MKRTALFIPALLLCLSSYSQNSYRERYMEAAGPKAVLFTGEAAPHYSARYTNTRYAYGDIYQMGTVVYDGLKYDGVLMNLDICAGCLCVRADISSMPVALLQEKVSEFSYGGHRFLNLDLSSLHPAGAGINGYAELLGESDDMILVKKSRKYSSEELTDRQVVRSFKENTEYWLVGRDAARRLTSGRNFYKLFPRKKQELKSALRSVPDGLRDDRAYTYRELFKTITAE